MAAPKRVSQSLRNAGVAGCASIALCLGGCRDTPASSFVAASAEAGAALSLFYTMAAVGTLLWLAVIGLAIYATWIRPGPHAAQGVRLLLFGGGVALPTVVLTALLVYGLSMPMPLEARRPDLRIEITGERWWWRVRYLDDAGHGVELANELRLPLDRHAGLALRSAEVIHSLWIPALGGKRDLLPGRVNHIGVTPTRPGLYRGTCAEYCGDGHANMGLVVEVMPAAEFDAWLAGQREDAAGPMTAAAARGAAVFLRHGCPLCHTVRGTAARGRTGPDLTHLGARHTLAAGLLPVDAPSIARWLTHPDRLKPGTLMPRFELPPPELEDLAHYLAALR
ncbi:MAG TPA: c-type cytochrome [Gammaproteobacteria bacterium]|nr:c-type cytochrome [Gammaproteobacteria bacterium]